MTKLARELDGRRKTFPKLAEKSGLSTARLNELAAGSEATLKELRLLAKAIGRDVTDFAPTAVGSDEERVDLMFRGEFTAKKELLKKKNTHGRAGATEVQSGVFSARIARALTLLSSEKSQLDWLDPFECREATYLDAERNAELFRRLFFRGDNVSPLVSLPRLVTEQLGVLLFVVAGERVDGASAAVSGQAFVFISPRTFFPRMLFTLAHEIGHFVARSVRDQDFVSVDAEGSVGHFAGPAAKEESYCNAFASCLLLPRAGVGSTLRTIREMTGVSGDLGDIELLLLSRAYGVSFEVAARRCEDLNLLPEGGARSLQEALTGKHGSPEKRATELGLPEGLEITFPTVPPRLLDAAVRGVSRGDVSIGAAAGLLNAGIGALMQAHRRPVASA